MRATILLLIFLPTAALAVPLVVYDPNDATPERVVELADGPASLCDGHAACVVDPDIAGLDRDRWRYWVHDGGAIRMATAAELNAKGYNFNKNTPENAMLLLRSLVRETCTELKALGMAQTCAAFVAAVRAGALD